MKKTNHFICTFLYLLFIFFILTEGSSFLWAQDPTPESGIGSLFFVPQDKIHTMIDFYYIEGIIPPLPSFPIILIGPYTFTTEVHLNSGDNIVATYGFNINFDSSVVVINTNEGQNGVSAGAEGFVSAVNSDTQGELTASGFDASGKGPGYDLHLITIHWLAQTYEGTTTVILTPLTVTDLQQNVIVDPAPVTGTITIETLSCILGDFNNDGVVNIIDALLLAQWYVGLEPFGVDPICGDVDNSGSINIADALLIAQYYVGLIATFPY